MTTFFEIGVCPWPDLSSLFQYTSPTPVVSLHLIPRIQYHPGISVTLLTGSSLILKCLTGSHMTTFSKLNYRLRLNVNMNIADSISLYFNFRKGHYVILKVNPHIFALKCYLSDEMLFEREGFKAMNAKVFTET